MAKKKKNKSFGIEANVTESNIDQAMVYSFRVNADRRDIGFVVRLGYDPETFAPVADPRYFFVCQPGEGDPYITSIAEVIDKDLRIEHRTGTIEQALFQDWLRNNYVKNK
jgi:hypothetical protein